MRGGSGTMTLTPPASWEELRKRARHLENEIDGKLLSLNKVGVALGGAEARFDLSSQAPAEGASEAAFDKLASDLDMALAKLQTLNDQMATLVEGSGGTPSPALHHTLQRHRSILRDYANEFAKTRANIRAGLERKALLNGGSASEAGGGLRGRDSTASFLRENDSAKSSDRLLDEQISIAMETKERVAKQRGGLHDIQKKIQTLTKKYPALNSLMKKIAVKKRRDAIVLGGVIALCLFLMFLYVSR